MINHNYETQPTKVIYEYVSLYHDNNQSRSNGLQYNQIKINNEFCQPQENMYKNNNYDNYYPNNNKSSKTSMKWYIFVGLFVVGAIIKLIDDKMGAF